MKKLILKKDIVARINSGEMNQFRGGAVDTYMVCESIAQATCTAGQTCEPNVGCGDATKVTCGNVQEYTGCTGGFNTMYCNTGGGLTNDICGLTHVVSQCDSCYVRCTA